MQNYVPFHIPVLATEIISLLVDKNTRYVFDGTLGLGGHAKKILKKYPKIKKYFATELDSEHIKLAKKNLHSYATKLSLYQDNFSNIHKILTIQKKYSPLSILFDLGLCSSQIDNPKKGFAFSRDGKLKMSFDNRSSATAQKLLNTCNQRELTQIIRKYGEEPSAKKIAKNIISFRQKKQLETTEELREIITHCVNPKNLSRTLVRVFQAIRIAVNNELTHLTLSIHNSFKIMHPGDRLGIISYHSLEDRITKQLFVKASSPITKPGIKSLHEIVAPAKFKILSKKPIRPTKTEIAKNPRSRSAHLRIIEKI